LSLAASEELEAPDKVLKNLTLSPREPLILYGKLLDLEVNTVLKFLLLW
jgi:hypothetical protein